MGIVRGIKSINKHIEDKEARSSGGSDGPKTVWFKIKDKQSVNVVFLQELDEDSPNFSKKNDLGFVAVEHVNPDNYKRKALCTIDDQGACYGCEQHQKDFKAGWGQRSKFYINVLVDEGGGKDKFVAVLSQGQSGKQITPTLMEYATDDETITDKWFSIKRSGEGLSDTSYTLRAKKEHDLNVEDYELFDLTKVVRDLPYAEQEAFYRQGEQEKTEAEPEAPSSDSGNTSVDQEW